MSHHPSPYENCSFWLGTYSPYGLSFFVSRWIKDLPPAVLRIAASALPCCPAHRVGGIADHLIAPAAGRQKFRFAADNTQTGNHSTHHFPVAYRLDEGSLVFGR